MDPTENRLETLSCHLYQDIRELEDEVSRANTEDSLLSSQSSSNTVINSRGQNDRTNYYTQKNKKKKCGSAFQIIGGIILVLWGIASIVYTPFTLFMNERLRMTPGFPPYEWWRNPPDEVLLRAYLFNITNAEEFLSGVDKKIKLQEVGPIIYLEKLIHSNITFNDNSTMTYVATRKAIYLPHLNSIDLNQTLVVPNFALLGMASYFWDANFFTKFAFNLLVRNANSEPIKKTTIYNYLWNFSDPILHKAKKIAPKMVPVSNMGILSRIYDKFEDTVNVYVGTTHGNKKYFLIDKYDGSEFLIMQGRSCDDKVEGSTEGVAYPQFLTKNSTLKYWRKTICKVASLYYKHDVESKHGIKAYKFHLPNTTYYRTTPTYSDCYRSYPPLENGLSDVSKCYYEMPMAASFPHFLYGDPNLLNYVDGMKPDEKKHSSFAIVEPITGIPLESMARSQSNLVLRKLDGFQDKIERFSDLILPIFWLEYNQVGLPDYISRLMYFTVVVLPPLQTVITALLLIGGGLVIAMGIRRRVLFKRQHNLMKNKTLAFEKEVFLNKI